MTADAIGAAFVLVLSLILAVSHLGAGRDPYRNFITQLVFGWYEAHSPYDGEKLRRLLKICGVFYFVLAAAFVVVLAFELAR
jgi:hypothetical protein